MQHVGNIAVDVMHEAMFQGRPWRPAEPDAGMQNPVVGPRFDPAAIKGRHGPTARKKHPSPSARAARQYSCRPGPGARTPATWRQPTPISAASSGAYPLVGIDLEYPVAAAVGDGGVAPSRLALPRALDDTIGKAARDLARAVTAAVEQRRRSRRRKRDRRGTRRAARLRCGRRREPTASAPGWGAMPRSRRV